MSQNKTVLVFAEILEESFLVRTAEEWMYYESFCVWEDEEGEEPSEWVYYYAKGKQAVKFHSTEKMPYILDTIEGLDVEDVSDTYEEYEVEKQVVNAVRYYVADIVSGLNADYPHPAILGHLHKGDRIRPTGNIPTQGELVMFRTVLSLAEGLEKALLTKAESHWVCYKSVGMPWNDEEPDLRAHYYVKGGEAVKTYNTSSLPMFLESFEGLVTTDVDTTVYPQEVLPPYEGDMIRVQKVSAIRYFVADTLSGVDEACSHSVLLYHLNKGERDSSLADTEQPKIDGGLL